MSTFSERPDSEQAQRLFFASARLPPGLVEAATLLGYWTMRDAEDRDVPTVAAFWMKRQTDFYLSKTFEVSSLGRFLANGWNHSL